MCILRYALSNSLVDSADHVARHVTLAALAGNGGLNGHLLSVLLEGWARAERGRQRGGEEGGAERERASAASLMQCTVWHCCQGTR